MADAIRNPDTNTRDCSVFLSFQENDYFAISKIL